MGVRRRRHDLGVARERAREDDRHRRSRSPAARSSSSSRTAQSSSISRTPQGVGRMTSTDDGQTWTGPIQTQSHTVGPRRRRGRRARRDAVLQPGRHRLRQRLPRAERREREERLHTLLRLRANRLPSTRPALVQVAFYSNADPGRHVPLRAARRRSQRRRLDARSSRPRSTPTACRSSPTTRATTFLAWPPGYPTATASRSCRSAAARPPATASTSAAPSSAATRTWRSSVDSQDRLWVVWTRRRRGARRALAQPRPALRRDRLRRP